MQYQDGERTVVFSLVMLTQSQHFHLHRLIPLDRTSLNSKIPRNF